MVQTHATHRLWSGYSLTKLWIFTNLHKFISDDLSNFKLESRYSISSIFKNLPFRMIIVDHEKIFSSLLRWMILNEDLHLDLDQNYRKSKA